MTDPGPEVGAFAVVRTGTAWSTQAIRRAQWAADALQGRWHHGLPPWDHVVVVSSVTPFLVVEAVPNGAREVRWNYQRNPHLWSTGRVKTSPDAALAARRYADAHIGYAWEDYAAIALHALRIPAPGLRAYIRSTGHMICSQLVDRCELDAGVHLFSDGRWEGYATPFDLADLILAGGTCDLRKR